MSYSAYMEDALALAAAVLEDGGNYGTVVDTFKVKLDISTTLEAARFAKTCIFILADERNHEQAVVKANWFRAVHDFAKL